jgi:hypothetical protein
VRLLRRFQAHARKIQTKNMKQNTNMNNSAKTNQKVSADQKLRDRAAHALDKTHAVGERGPKTFAARNRIATALDKGTKPLLRDIKWLERIADSQGWEGRHASLSPRLATEAA